MAQVPRYGVPQEAKDAMRKRIPKMVMIQISLPPAAGGTVRWTNYPYDFIWDGRTWAGNSPYRMLDVPTAQEPGEPGTMAVVVADPERGWNTRFLLAGPRGIPVETHYLQPMETTPPSVYKVGGFTGTAQSVRAVHNEDTGDQETRLIVADKLYYNRLSKGNFIAQSFQRSLDANDNSLDLTDEVFDLVWHQA